MDSKETFHYTYSAKERAEIEAIRKRYAPPEAEDALTRLRRLDAAVTQKATLVSLILGILGALILGFGMSLIMTDFIFVFGIPRSWGLLFGIVTGAFGIVLISVAYPVYNRIVRAERERISPEILRLADELMK